jgi:uncharacterized protein
MTAISATTRPGRDVTFFFVLTFAYSWGLAALWSVLFGDIALPLFVLLVAGPTLAALALTARREGAGAALRLASRLLRWRAPLRPWLIAAVATPLAGWLIGRLFATAGELEPLPLSALLPLLVMLVITGPLGEELGWRGYALPRLLQRFSPFAATLLLGLVWGVWHLPAFFLSGLPQEGLPIGWFMLMALGLSVIATMLYLDSAGALLPVIVFHFMVNFSMSVLAAPLIPFAVATTIAAASIVILDHRRWFALTAQPSFQSNRPEPAVHSEA